MSEQCVSNRKQGLYKSRARSRITNGTDLLVGIDHRTAWVRRFRDVLALHSSDIPNASHAEQALIRRATCLVVECERLEAKFAETGGATNTKLLDKYQRCANSLRRILETLGLERRARNVTPHQTLDEICEEIAAGEPAEAGAS